ncbi:MAG: hypothetical protein HC799_09940 [Limnothrix sp. RL_2_0]|nr:hypothetical protein [Limnothrix sp. RL_2_0]
MKESELQRLAEQGNGRAIAEVLKPIFRTQQIHVITKIEGVNLLKIQLESSVTPDRAIAEEILAPWQQIWQTNLTKTVIVEGWQFGETEASWQWTIVKGLLSQSAIKQSPDSFAAITSPKKAEFDNQQISQKLKKSFAQYLWQTNVSPLNNALMIKLVVLDQRDRREYCDIVRQTLQNLDIKEFTKIHLHVYQRKQQKYLLKTSFALNQPLPNITLTKSYSTRSLPTASQSAMLIGCILGVVLFLFPLSRFVLNAFLTLVHEIGHAIASWIFGIPAIPSFDFIFGGGVTIGLSSRPVTLLIFAIYGGLAYLAFLYCRNRLTLIFCAAIALIYGLFLITNWDQLSIISMGHIAEILVSFLCLYFACGKYFCYVGGEQTIYAMLGSFSFLENCSFFWNLIFNASFKAVYYQGKGGVLDNDLVRLSQVIAPLSLENIAALLLLISLMMPALAFLTFRYESRWIPTFYRMCQRSPQ